MNQMKVIVGEHPVEQVSAGEQLVWTVLPLSPESAVGKEQTESPCICLFRFPLKNLHIESVEGRSFPIAAKS